MRRLPRASRRSALLVVAGLVGVHLGAIAAYLDAAAVVVRRPRYYLYPVVWITVTAWIALRVRPAPGSASPLAGLGSAAYLAVVLAISGTVTPSQTAADEIVPTLSVLPMWIIGHASSTGLVVEWLAPGWGPYVAYRGTLLTVRIVPFQLIGYLGLAYLVFVALTRASRSALFGAGGLVTCVGCVWPALTALSAALGGGGLLASANQWSYDLSTLVFLATVCTMCWLLSERPMPVSADGLRAVGLPWRSG
jgi:hypothetical protein